MDSRINIAIVAKIKQGDLYAALKKRGWTVARASRELGISQQRLGDLINLKRLPRFTLEEELKLAELTGKTLEEMLPKDFNAKMLLEGRRELVAFQDCDPRTLTAAGFRALPVPLGEEDQVRLALAEQFLSRLYTRERSVIKLLYVEGYELDEAAEEMKVTRSRVEQIRNRALKKLREMSKDRKLVERMTPK